MKYRLFISDYDGTLSKYGGSLDGSQGVDAETLKAIKEYERRGGVFVVCTGRMFGNIRSICEKYDIADVVVSYQGARINERKSGRTLFDAKLDYALSVDVLRSIEDLPIKPVVLFDDTLYYAENSAYTEAYKNTDAVKLVKTDDLIGKVVRREIEALKINCVCEGAYLREFTREFGEKYKGKLIVNSGGPNLAEFVNPAASKGSAVKFLSEYYGVSYDGIIAVGDSTNDIELISGAWHGVAVGDGREELKAVADEITVPYAERPVKALLEKYCL